MAINALNSAATGLRVLSDRIDVIANNLANAETQAFKRQRMNFEDLIYLNYRQPGTTDNAGYMNPEGISVGLGAKVSNTELDLTQGSLESTGNPLDLAIEGDGFFKVKILPSQGGDGTGYTRNGALTRNANGQLVVGIGDGYLLQPPISIPNGATNVAIAQDGIVQYQPQGSVTPVNAGQILLTNFVNPQGLRLEGGSIYTVTASSGPANTNPPGISGNGILLQSYIEESNVDPVKELVTLIKTQRSFELNSQSIQTADQTLQTVANLKKS